MSEIQADLPSFSPELLADFERKNGQEGSLKMDDEFHITILGPWNAFALGTRRSKRAAEGGSSAGKSQGRSRWR